ncbi:AraC family transcriptional regulator [Flavitalea sp.]|nr:AraC family transcriptional regulator [Flavitalea sp.]
MNEHINESLTGRTILHFDELGFKDVYLLGKYSYTHVQNKLDSHCHHQMIEICYCDKGQQVYEVEGKEYQIKGGEVFVTFPNELHSTDNHPEEKGVLYWLQVKIPTTDSFLGYCGDDARFFINQLLSLPARHFKGSITMKRTLDEILDRAKQPTPAFNKLIIPNLITQFLLNVIKSSQSESSTLDSSDRIIIIKNYISEHLYSNLSILEIAKKFNISTSHFKSWFKKQTGIPPADYFLRLKIEEAKKQILQDHELTITTIAYRLNFSTSQYFATVFKRYAGMSPLEFKKRYEIPNRSVSSPFTHSTLAKK